MAVFQTTDELCLCLQVKLDLLKRNKENVPESELLGRYSVSYNKLLAEIEELTVCLYSAVMRNVRVKPQYFSKEMAENIFNEYRKAIYEEYSAKKGRQILRDFLIMLVEARAIFILDIDFSRDIKYNKFI